VKHLATFGESFTNNGLAISPDGGSVFVTLIGSSSLSIERISTRTGRRTFVAFGAQPTVSPNGRLLAYAAGREDQELSVRQLSSGKTTTFDLRPLIGDKASLLDGQIAWLSNGYEIALAPKDDPITTGVASLHRSQTRKTACSKARIDQLCLIVVDLRTSKSPPKVMLLSVPEQGQIYSCLSVPNAVELVIWTGYRTLVEAVRISGTGLHAVTLAELAPDVVMAASPSGGEILYLIGHTPPGLWLAELSGGRLLNAHLLVRSSQFGAIAW
jgi:hypothetical protein